MNSLLRTNSSRSTIFSRRESQESIFPVLLKEELLSLKLPETKRKELVDEKMEMRQMQLEGEMQIAHIQYAKDKEVNRSEFGRLLTHINYIKRQKRNELNLIKVAPIQEEGLQTKSCQLNDDLIAEQEDIRDGLMNIIESLKHDIRLKRRECNQVSRDLEKIERAQPKVDQNLFENKKVLRIMEKQNHNIRESLKSELEWQNEQLEKKQLLSNQKEKLMKEDLEQFIDQEEYIAELENELWETEQTINELTEQISMKFNKIEECAEFLDELDDFDKLTLIFVYEDPSQFELEEILQQAKYQLSQPKNRIMLEYTEQEYIDRARFSSVSSRMQIFLKFHENKLNQSVDQLVQVFRKLQFQELTQRTRYEDLLCQRKKLRNQLDFLNQQQYYEIPEVINEREAWKNILMDESNKEEAWYLTQAQIRHVEQMQQFFVRIYTMLTGVLLRMMNALQNVKEILKSCTTDVFDEIFYLKWTYNRLFQKLIQIKSHLEKQFHIRIIAKDPNIRNSNQLLNAIYDHLEERTNRQKTHIHNKPSHTLQTLFPQYNFLERQEIQSTISQDIFLQQFFKLNDLEMLIDHFRCHTIQDIVDLILTEGYHVAHQHLRTQTQYLIQIIEEAILDSRNMHSQTVPAQKLTQRYNLHEIIQSRSNTYEYKQKEWKKEVFENRLNSIKLVNGQYPPYDSRRDSAQIQLTETIQQNPPPVVKEAQTPKPPKTDTLINLFRTVNNIDSIYPIQKQTKVQESLQSPQMIRLHHMKRQIQKDKALNSFNPKHDQIEFPAHIELSSKKSLEQSNDLPMHHFNQYIIPKSLPKQFKSRSKCPQIQTNKVQKPRQSSETKTITEPTTHSIQDTNSIYSDTNRTLKSFFRIPQILNNRIKYRY